MLYILFAFIALWLLTAFFSYYLFYFLTFTVCSIGILAIFFWKIVWEGLYKQFRLQKDPDYKKKMAFYKEKKRNEQEEQLRKLPAFQKWKTITKEKLLSVFGWILVPCIFLGVPAGALAIGGNFLLDFPSFLLGKTETTTGYISHYEEVSGRKSLSYTLIEIENEDYLLTNHEEFYIGDQVQIHYLPHTKIIRDFEIIEDPNVQSDTPFTPPDPSLKDNPLIGSWEISTDDEYISLLLSETGLANLGEHKGDEAIFYNGRWKYDENKKMITFEVNGAEDLTWKPVEHPEKIEIKVLTHKDDSLEIEYLQKKIRLEKVW